MVLFAATPTSYRLTPLLPPGDKDVSSYSEWKTEGNWDCSESPPANPGPKWIVKLQPPMPDDPRDGDEDEACHELAQTTYSLYLRSLFEGRGGEHVFDNEYDGHEVG